MKLITFTISILLGFTLFSQDQLKFGKVPMEDLKLEECSFHPDADAMVLGKEGRLRFKYSTDKGWRYELEIIERIKIFNNDGKKYSDFKVVVYDPESGATREQISSIKATTYNLEGAKIVKSKLESSGKYETRLSEYRKEISFSMPNVKAGSVVEYRYLLTSDYIANLYEWRFQSDLPVAYSYFNYSIPEYFYYQVSQVGSYVNLEVDDKQFQETFIFNYQTQKSIPGLRSNETRTGTAQARIQSQSRLSTKIARNVPPLHDEPYMTNPSNIPARLEFQLMTIKMPDQPIRNVATTYSDFSKNIMSWENFGKTLDKGGFAKEKIDAIQSEGLDKVVAIYSWLQNHFTFNNVYAMASGATGRKAFNDKKGNSAAINLSLVAAFREAGFEAFPVILSTRGHGVPHPVYPSYEDFNYVISAVKVDDKMLLCDATTSLPPGVLPVRCLNNNGWLVREEGGEWIKLKNATGEQYSVTVQSELSILEDELVNSTSAIFKGYAARSEKRKLNNEEESGYVTMLSDHFSDEAELDFEDKSDPGNLKWSVTALSDFDGEDRIYISPINYGLITDNPFSREERFSNVDFAYKVSRRFMGTIEVPEGYTAELPKPTLVKLPNGGGTFRYNIVQQGNQIKITSLFNLKQLEFTPAEYPNIKQFFQMMVDKHQEVIVLSKT